jgi:hypothetical protein
MSEFIDPYAEAVRLAEKVIFLQFLAGYLYDSLGPANDDIWRMAQEAWVEGGNTLPEGYELEGYGEGPAEYGTFVGGVKAE